MKANLELQIDELMLEGLGELDAAGLGGAVERELGLLLTDRGLPDTLARGGDSEQPLDGGAFKMASADSEAGVATQIARAVFKGLNR
jgi:hypothetical protein